MVHGISWRRAASNVLLGIALGLISYYALTELVGWLGQRDLREQAADVPTFTASAPERLMEQQEEPPVALDFEKWDAEDRAYWEGLEDGEPFGRLVIPAMELDVIVVKGATPATLRQGPGWIGWTDLPGPTGTCGISGHRTTYGAPFRRLDEVTEGDTIDLFSPYRRYRYEVTASLVVLPSQVEVVASTEQPTLTLTACHPPYSAAYRLAVQASLVEAQRITGTPE